MRFHERLTITLSVLACLPVPSAYCWQTGIDLTGILSQTQSGATRDEIPDYLLPQRAAATIDRGTNGWLGLTGEFRLRFEGRTAANFRSGNDDSYLLTRVRLGLDFHPARWFRIYAEGQDAQAIGLKNDPDPPLFQDTFDLRQGFIEFFNREHQGVGLRVGRQELAFGDERLIGGFNWSNTARTFDAVRVFYARPKVRLDLFASSVVVIEDRVFNRHRDGENLYGSYNSIQNVIPKATVEGYILWRTSPLVRGEQGSLGDADVLTFGTRWVGKLPAGFDYRAELAGQSGDFAADDVGAWAVHTQLGNTLARVKTSPRLLVEYNYASGDDDPSDGKRGTFDQLYPTNHDKYGIADQVGWKNIHNFRAGLGLKVTGRATFLVDYHSFWLASRRDALYSAGGAPVARIPLGARSRHVGQEVDLDLRVTLARYLSLWGGYAHLSPGGFLKEATPGAGTGFYYAMMTYRF